MNIFNPEHDLCLANGDPNFVPPESALRFGRECAGLNSWIETGDGVIPWGWNSVLKRRLLKEGISSELLPSDDFLIAARELSHRRNALKAKGFLYERSSALRAWTSHSSGSEAFSCDEVRMHLDNYIDAVAKAPWSGSGKGLRWLRSGELSDNDLGWCANVIAKQGSVIVEKRETVVCDTAMLFSVGNDISYEGMSLFFNDNGAYKGNVLASDEWILENLTAYIPRIVLDEIRDGLAAFLRKEFLGIYRGFVGVDMFICRDCDGGFRIEPCVEINVRMTMGLLARRLFDRHLVHSAEKGLELSRDGGRGDLPSGRWTLRVEYSPDNLENILKNAALTLVPFSPGCRYSVAVFLK